MRKKISATRNKFEDLIQMAKHSEQGMGFLWSSLLILEAPLQKIVPAKNKMTLNHSLVLKFQMK